MRALCCVLAFACSCLFGGAAHAQNAVPHDVLGSGGGQSSGGGLYLHDTVGQPCIGITGGPSNINKIGYWYVVDKRHIGPTSEVAITAFETRVTEEGVLLSWAIGSAADLEGFNVYRSLKEELGFEKLNGSLLPANEAFRFLDEKARPGTTYWYMLGAVDQDGEFFSPATKVTVPPRETTLYQNHPNPFNPVTTVSFYIPETQQVSLAIYDAHGRLVRRLVKDRLEFGRHEETWDGLDDRGEPAASGVYFYRLKAGKKVITKKLTLLK